MLEQPQPEADRGTAPLGGMTAVILGESVAIGMTAKILRGLGTRTSRMASPTRPPLQGTVRDYLLRGIETLVPQDLRETVACADIVLVDDRVNEFEIPALGDLAARGALVGQITPWGERGARSGDPASELVVQAAAGLVNLVGRADREPLMLAGNQAAYSAGMQLFTGLMIALHHRDATGEGQIVRTSLLETMASLEWKGAAFYQADGKLLTRGQSTGPLILPTRDGHLAFYYRDIDWPRVREMFSDDRLGDARFESMPGRIAAEDELFAILAEHTVSRGKHELFHEAQGLGIPVGSVELVPDLLVDEQYAHQRFLCTSADGAGHPEPSLPFTFNGQRFDGADESPALVAVHATEAPR